MSSTGVFNYYDANNYTKQISDGFYVYANNSLVSKMWYDSSNTRTEIRLYGGDGTYPFGLFRNDRLGLYYSAAARTVITSDGVFNYNSDNYYTKMVSDGFYVYAGGSLRTKIGSGTIDLYAGAGTYPKTSLSSTGVFNYYNANNYTKQISDGLYVYANSSLVAKFGTTAYIYGTNASYPLFKADSSSVGMYYDANNHVNLSSGKLDFYTKGTKTFNLGIYSNTSSGNPIGSLQAINNFAIVVNPYGDIDHSSATTSNTLVIECFGYANVKRVSVGGDLSTAGYIASSSYVEAQTYLKAGSYLNIGDRIGVSYGSTGNYGLYDRYKSGWLHYSDSDGTTTRCYANYFLFKQSSAVSDGPYLSSVDGYVSSSGRIFASLGKAGMAGDDNYIYFYESTSRVTYRFSKSNGHHQYNDATNGWTTMVWYANDSRTKNTVLAAPNGSNGVASFRALVAADIPALALTSQQT